MPASCFAAVTTSIVESHVRFCSCEFGCKSQLPHSCLVFFRLWAAAARGCQARQVAIISCLLLGIPCSHPFVKLLCIRAAPNIATLRYPAYHPTRSADHLLDLMIQKLQISSSRQWQRHVTRTNKSNKRQWQDQTDVLPYPDLLTCKGVIFFF